MTTSKSKVDRDEESMRVLDDALVGYHPLLYCLGQQREDEEVVRSGDILCCVFLAALAVLCLGTMTAAWISGPMRYHSNSSSAPDDDPTCMRWCTIAHRSVAAAPRPALWLPPVSKGGPARHLSVGSSGGVRIDTFTRHQNRSSTCNWARRFCVSVWMECDPPQSV